MIQGCQAVQITCRGCKLVDGERVATCITDIKLIVEDGDAVIMHESEFIREKVMELGYKVTTAYSDPGCANAIGICIVK